MTHQSDIIVDSRQLAGIRPYVLITDDQMVVTSASELVLKCIPSAVGTPADQFVRLVGITDQLTPASVSRNLGLKHKLSLACVEAQIILTGTWIRCTTGFILLAEPDPVGVFDLDQTGEAEKQDLEASLDQLMRDEQHEASLEEAKLVVRRMLDGQDRPAGWVDRLVTDLEKYIDEKSDNVNAATGQDYAEAALKASEERYRYLIDNMAEGLAITDTKDVFRFANSAAEKVLGVEPGGLIGRSAGEFVEQDGLTLMVAQTQMRMEGEVSSYELQIIRNDGERRDLIIKASPYKDNDNSYAGTIAIFHDITERKQTEAALQANEERYRVLVEAMGQGLGVLNSKGIITYANEKMWELSGYSRKDFIGHHILEFFDERNKQVMVEQLAKRHKGERGTYEIEWTGKDGRQIPTLMSPVPLIDNEGNLEGIFAVVTDITEQKQAEQVLRRSEERYRQLVQNMGEGMAIADENDTFTYANPAAEKILGLETGSLPGRKLSEFLEDEGIQTTTNMTSVRRGGISNTYELKMKRADGVWRDLIITGSPHFDHDGAFRGGMGIMRDITDQKQAEADLVRARVAAEAASKSKGRFLANVSHELRTPLSVINGCAEILLEQNFGELNEKQQHVVKRVAESGEYLLAIFNDLLDLAKIEAGKMSIDSLPVDLAMVTREVTSMFEQGAVDKGLSLQYEGSAEPIIVTGDSLRLKQVLMNLLSNAIKFTDEGSIVTYLQLTQTEARWGVRDTGVGIDQGLISKLFKPFEQAESGLVSKQVGTGLGLALVKEIVLAHGGKINVTSKPGEGSDFHVLFSVKDGKEAGNGSKANSAVRR